MNTDRYLFRGKRKDFGEWVEGCLLLRKKAVPGVMVAIGCELTENYNLVAFIFPITNLPVLPFEVDPATVGQFTGLKDKNGVNIFEGDLVKNESGRICVVVWHTNSAQWDYNVFANYDKTNANNFCNQEASRLEIVGNIHDTPELLTQQK